jgi:carbamoyl-phosphate synthase small subunit
VKGKIVNADADESSSFRIKINNFPNQSGRASFYKNTLCKSKRGFKVVLVDFGSKLGIIRELSQRNCDIIVVSQDTTAEEIL